MKRQLKILNEVAPQAEACLQQLRRTALTLENTTAVEQRQVLLKDYAVQLDKLRRLTTTLVDNVNYITQQSKFRNQTKYTELQAVYTRLVETIKNTAEQNQRLKSQQFAIDSQLAHSHSIPKKQLVLNYWGLPDLEEEFRRLNQQQIIDPRLVQTYADNLMAFSREAFSKITLNEWANPAKYNDAKHCPNMLGAANKSDALTYYVVENILKHEAIDDRTFTFEFWVQVAHASLQQGDFFSAGAITNGLISESIGRLNKTKAGLADKTQRQLAELIATYSLEGNFAKLRKAQRQFSGPLVPCLLYLAKDMVLDLDRIAPGNTLNSQLFTKAVENSLEQGLQTIETWQEYANEQKAKANDFAVTAIGQGIQNYLAKAMAGWHSEQYLAYLTAFKDFMLAQGGKNSAEPIVYQDIHNLKSAAQITQEILTSLEAANKNNTLGFSLNQWLDLAIQYHNLGHHPEVKTIVEVIHNHILTIMEPLSTSITNPWQWLAKIKTQLPQLQSEDTMACEDIIANLKLKHADFAPHKMINTDRKIAKNILATVQDYQLRLSALPVSSTDNELISGILNQATDKAYIADFYKKSMQYEPRDEQQKPQTSRIISDFINNENIQQPLDYLNDRLQAILMPLAHLSAQIENLTTEINAGISHPQVLLNNLTYLQHERAQLLKNIQLTVDLANNYKFQLQYLDKTAYQASAAEERLAKVLTQAEEILTNLATQGKQLVNCGVWLAKDKPQGQAPIWRCFSQTDNPSLLERVKPLLQKHLPTAQIQIAEEEIYIPCQFFATPGEQMVDALAVKVKLRFQYSTAGTQLLSYSIDAYHDIAKRLLPELKLLAKEGQIILDMPEDYAKLQFDIPAKSLQKNRLSLSRKKPFETGFDPSFVTDPLYDLPEYLTKTAASFSYEAWQKYSGFEPKTELEQKLASAIQNYCAMKITPENQDLLQPSETSQLENSDLQDLRNLYAARYPELMGVINQTLKVTQKWLLVNPKHSAAQQIKALHMRLLIDQATTTYNYYQLFYKQIEPTHWNDRVILLNNLQRELLGYQENLAREKFNLNPKQFEKVAKLIHDYLAIINTELQLTAKKQDVVMVQTAAPDIDQLVAQSVSGLALGRNLEKSYTDDILNLWVISHFGIQQLYTLPSEDEERLKHYGEECAQLKDLLEENFSALQAATTAADQQQLCNERLQLLHKIQTIYRTITSDPRNNLSLNDGKNLLKLCQMRIPKTFLDYVPGDKQPSKYGPKFDLNGAATREIAQVEEFLQRLKKHVANETKQNHASRSFVEGLGHSLVKSEPHSTVARHMVAALASCGLRSSHEANTPLYQLLNATPITINFGNMPIKKISHQAAMADFLNYLLMGLNTENAGENIQSLRAIIEHLQQKPQATPEIAINNAKESFYSSIKSFFANLWYGDNAQTEAKQPRVESVLPKTLDFKFAFNEKGEQASLSLQINANQTMQVAFIFPNGIQSELPLTGKKEIFVDVQEIESLKRAAKGYVFEDKMLSQPPQNARIQDKVSSKNHLLTQKTHSTHIKPTQVPNIVNEDGRTMEPGIF